MKIYSKHTFWFLALSIVITTIAGLKVSNADTVSGNDTHQHKKEDVALAPKTPGGTADEKYIVFVANGRFETVDGTFMKDGVMNGDGIGFQHNVMKRSDDEIEELKQEAVNFFDQRFGIDVMTNTSVVFTGYEMDPRINLRAYTVSRESDPASGLPVDDGGWAVLIVDPAGVTLGGVWEGFHLPFNSMLLFGEVVINAKSDKIVIHYESDIPFIIDQFNAAQVRFRTTNEEFGEGSVGGIARFEMLDPNSLLLQVDIRNILTAPGVLSGI